MLTVACVLRSGGLYDASWVARLRAGVGRHLRQPHRFVCLSDVPVPCERIPLQHDWPGWWAKMEVFRVPGPVLYLDLDTTLVGDLAEIAAAAATCPFLMLRDFYRPQGLGSGVMGWSEGPMQDLYDRFAAEPHVWMATCGDRGDQGYIEDAGGLAAAYRWQDAVPGQIVSYKVHCRTGIPAGARLVCLHGRPKFTDMVPSDPVRQAWEMAA